MARRSPTAPSATASTTSTRSPSRRRGDPADRRQGLQRRPGLHARWRLDSISTPSRRADAALADAARWQRPGAGDGRRRATTGSRIPPRTAKRVLYLAYEPGVERPSARQRGRAAADGPDGGNGAHPRRSSSAGRARSTCHAGRPTAGASPSSAIPAPDRRSTLQYTRLGRTGLEVSHIGFGTMSFGKKIERRPVGARPRRRPPALSRRLGGRHQLFRHRQRLRLGDV